MPSPDIDMEDIPEFPGLFKDEDEDEDEDDENEPYTSEDSLEDRDCVFVAMIPCKAEFI